MKRSKTASDDLLDALPEASSEDAAALRKARALTLDSRRARLLQQALRHPTYEELARRPILDGEPFRL